MTRSTRRALVFTLLVALFWVGGGMVANAWHGACPDGINLTPGTGRITYVSTSTTPTSQSVCWTALDPDPNGNCAVGANCGGFTVFIEDQSPSLGTTVREDGGSTSTGNIDVGRTGAELGTFDGFTCVRGTTVWVDGAQFGPFGSIGVCS